VIPKQKAELEALEQKRGGVDRESAVLTEEVPQTLNIIFVLDFKTL
jgi:hypothetical protein